MKGSVLWESWLNAAIVSYFTARGSQVGNEFGGLSSVCGRWVAVAVGVLSNVLVM